MHSEVAIGIGGRTAIPTIFLLPESCHTAMLDIPGQETKTTAVGTGPGRS
jgi:hypothetical protein